MNNQKLAGIIAEAIMECGDEPERPTTRIQFMSGSWSENTEKTQGGLCKASLASLIQDALNRVFMDNAPQQSEVDELEDHIIKMNKARSNANKKQQSDIKELAEALHQAGCWLTETDNEYYVRGNCLKELASKHLRG